MWEIWFGKQAGPGPMYPPGCSCSKVLAVDCAGLSWDKDNNVLGEDSEVTRQGLKWWGISILGDHPDSPGHGPKPPAVAVMLALLGAGLDRRPAA